MGSLTGYSPWGCRVTHDWAPPNTHTHTHTFLSMGSKSASLCPHRLSAARFLCLWNFPGKNIGGGFPFPTPRNLPDSGIEPTSLDSPALAGNYVTTEPPGKPLILSLYINNHFLCTMDSLSYSPLQQIPHGIFHLCVPHCVNDRI